MDLKRICMHTHHVIKKLVRLTALSFLIMLPCGLSGCTIATDTQANHSQTPPVEPQHLIAAPTSGVNIPQAATDTEVISPQRETGISREEDSQLTPSHPDSLAAQAITGVIVLTWKGTGDDRIEYYQVYRRVADDETWQFIARVKAAGDNRELYEFRDKATERDVTYIYGVSAVDTYGNESEITESSAVTSR